MKKTILFLASMICLFVVVSLVSCGDDDDNSSSPSGSGSFADDWMIPCLDWGVSISEVKSYMDGFGDWVQGSDNTIDNTLTYHHKSQRQSIVYLFISDSQSVYSLYASCFYKYNSSEKEFNNLKSYLESKFTFTMSVRDEDFPDAIAYYCKFLHGGRSHMVVMIYSETEKSISLQYMNKPSD